MLVVTTWLPTRERPELGAFIRRDIEMLARDHEVQVLHLSTGGAALPLLPGAVSLTTMPMSPGNPLSLIKAGVAISRLAADVDLVHSMAASALLPMSGVRRRRPWVHTEHWSALLAPSTAGPLARAAIPLTARLLQRPDLVIAVGHRLAAAVDRHRTGPTTVIPNAVDRPPALRERPGGKALRLVGVGGLIPRKGADIAIGAIAELRARGVDARLEWVGDGPRRAELLTLSERLGVSSWVRFRGAVSPQDVPVILSAADAFLLPTTMETFGVAIAEALVAGRPVVVGADGEQASFVAEPDGVLVKEQSAVAYANAVQRVIALNETRTAAEIAAAATTRFDDAARRTAYAEAYEQVATRRESPTQPDVDVVIAVHDASRQIDRAVRSSLTSDSVARVIVVCHDVEPDDIAARLPRGEPRVQLVAFRDGIRSPAGPFNKGLELATSRYVALVGSDDELTAGAVDAWRRTADRDGADAVIAPLRYAGGGRVPTPPTRRRRSLRGARDRLAYRTAPLGIIARERIRSLRMTEGLPTGEDLAFSSRLWFGHLRVSRHSGVWDYLIHDGEGRVTFTPRALRVELAAVALLIDDAWACALPNRDRVALAVKLWRVNVFGAVHYRAGEWTRADREWLSGLVSDLERFAPGASSRLSRADVALIGALRDPEVPDAQVDLNSRRRRRFVSVAALLPARVMFLLAREAPLRFSAATWWAGRR